MVQKVTVTIKVLLLKGAPPDHFVREFALQVHEELEHLVVGLAREEDAARVELVDGAGGAPHVNGIVVGHTQDDFRSPVETRHQIRGDFVLVDFRRRPKITQFQH